MPLKLAAPENIEIAKVFIEKGNVFDLSALKELEKSMINELAKEVGVDPSVIRSGFIQHFLRNGSARNVETSGFGILLTIQDHESIAEYVTKLKQDGKKENDKGDVSLSTDEDNEINGLIIKSRRVVDKIAVAAKAQYEGIKTGNYSASGSKLFMRLNANLAVIHLLSEAQDLDKMKSMNKIATKLALAERFDIAIAVQSFPDIFKISPADGKRFLRIMAAYQKRQRSGKNKKDVNGEDINQKEIFISLCERLLIAHPEIGTLDGTFFESIWVAPDLQSSDKADGASQVLIGVETDKEGEEKPAVRNIASYFK